MMNEKYEHYDTARINAISITEVARRLDNVKRVGSVYKTLCPWHNDNHPSLTLYERTNENHCHCFSCGKGGSVIDYVMQHENWSFQEACQWLSHEYGILTTDYLGPKPRLTPKSKPKPTMPEYTYIPMEMLDELVSTNSSFCQCLMQMYRWEAVEWIVEEYKLGVYSINGQDGFTVFPNIDNSGRVCNLKVQYYDTDYLSERFAHSIKGSCYWLGKMWSKEGKLPKNAEFKTNCLFGEHLLSKYPSAPVVLVESPKNAILGAITFPYAVWVATGNKNQLKRDVLKPLQGRNVIVIPDRDAIGQWRESITKMTDLANFTISDFCEGHAIHNAPKCDIADILIEERRCQQQA